MENTKLYEFLENHNVPKNMYEEINNVIWPVYNGKVHNGVRSVNPLSLERDLLENEKHLHK